MNTSEWMTGGLAPIFPAIAMMGAACVLVAMGMFQSNTDADPVHDRLGSGFAWTSLGFLILIGLWWTLGNGAGVEVSGSLFQGGLVNSYGTQLALLCGVLIVCLSINMTPRRYPYEYHACLLFLLSGIILVAAAADITTLYLGLEMVSIPTIVLLASSRIDEPGRESTLKYFALSAFSSAIFLMGISYWFGLAGTTSLDDMVRTLANETSLVGRLAVGLVVAGLAFRVTAVPFHAYAPDVFAGCALPMTALMASLPKVAGFIALIRLFGGDQLDAGLVPSALNVLVILALISMTYGNLGALAQTSWRKLFAYSSIAHSGYLLLGLAAVLVRGSGPQPVLAYLVAYSVMTIGMIAGMATMLNASDKDASLEDMQGIFSQRPWLAAAMTVCLLSLVGMPLTAGFWAKFYILSESIASQHPLLRIGAIVLVINSAIAAMYYLGMMYRFYVKRGVESQPLDSQSQFSTAGLTCVICAVLTIVWFVWPAWM